MYNAMSILSDEPISNEITCVQFDWHVNPHLPAWCLPPIRRSAIIVGTKYGDARCQAESAASDAENSGWAASDAVSTAGPFTIRPAAWGVINQVYEDSCRAHPDRTFQYRSLSPSMMTAERGGGPTSAVPLTHRPATSENAAPIQQSGVDGPASDDEMTVIAQATAGVNRDLQEQSQAESSVDDHIPDVVQYWAYFLPEGERESFLGDADEMFANIVLRFGRRRAIIWLRWQFTSRIVHLLRKPGRTMFRWIGGSTVVAWLLKQAGHFGPWIVSKLR